MARLSTEQYIHQQLKTAEFHHQRAAREYAYFKNDVGPGSAWKHYQASQESYAREKQCRKRAAHAKKYGY